jgi:hypothetical protein
VYAEPDLSSDQRVGDESVEYTVFFDTQEGEKAYNPGSLNEFGQYLIGSTWSLRLNALGGVVSVE